MAIVNGYATLPQLRSELGITDVTQTGDDSKLELAVEAASRQIDGYCDRRFWQDAAVKVREFYAESPTCCPVDDISTTTGLIVKIDEDGDGTFETTLTIATDFILLPANAEDDTPARPYDEIRLVENYSFPRLSNGRPGVQVTAKFGFAAVPDDVEKACIVQAISLYKSKDAAFGGVALGDFGATMFLRAALHPVAKSLVDHWARASVG